MKNNTKNINKSTPVWQIIVVLVFAIGFSIGAIIYGKTFSYKETNATLISHEEVQTSEADYSAHCYGMVKYNVNGIDYESKIYLDYHYCYDGYETTIYYDENNPQNAVKEKSTFVFIVLLILSIIFAFGLIYLLFDLLNNKKKKSR